MLTNAVSYKPRTIMYIYVCSYFLKSEIQDSKARELLPFGGGVEINLNLWILPIALCSYVFKE